MSSHRSLRGCALGQMYQSLECSFVYSTRESDITSTLPAHREYKCCLHVYVLFDQSAALFKDITENVCRLPMLTCSPTICQTLSCTINKLSHCHHMTHTYIYTECPTVCMCPHDSAIHFTGNDILFTNVQLAL